MNGEITTVQFGLFAVEDITAADGSVIPADGLIETINCSEDGTAFFATDLPMGSYYVKETSTDKHYTLPDIVSLFPPTLIPPTNSLKPITEYAMHYAAPPIPRPAGVAIPLFPFWPSCFFMIMWNERGLK